MKHIAIFLVRLYGLFISPFFPPTCRYQPTCSQYAIEAFRKFGFLAGGIRSLKRLLRCHPWGGKGYDPLP